MKGGVFLDKSQFGNRRQALMHFIENSDIRILSNNTISCISLLVKLKDGSPTPFKSIRLSQGLGRDVRQILLKIFPSDSTASKVVCTDIHLRERDRIEIATRRSLEMEVRTQMDIYFRTLMSDENFFDPICPCIIDFEFDSRNITVDKILEKLVPRDDSLHRLAHDKYQVMLTMNAGRRLSETRGEISIIAMEFLEGFTVGYDSIPIDIDARNADQEKLAALVKYEIEKLHDLGYAHGDIHLGNFMTSLTSEYLQGTQSESSVDKGRVLLIDFGRTQYKYTQRGYAAYGYDRLNMFNAGLRYTDKYTNEYIKSSVTAKCLERKTAFIDRNSLTAYDGLFKIRKLNHEGFFTKIFRSIFKRNEENREKLKRMIEAANRKPSSLGGENNKNNEKYENNHTEKSELIIIEEHGKLLEELYDEIDEFNKEDYKEDYSYSKEKTSKGGSIKSKSKSKSKSKTKKITNHN
uniref:Protein kinase domain-containing protein n=1 Tax=viral metagenome TaxID=1070528 RepID=A0A6C0HYW7_9ZZZZ